MQRAHPVLLGAHDGMARRFNPADTLAVRGTQFEFAGDTRAQRGGDRATSFPGCVHFDVAASPKSAEAAFRPCRWQRRQKRDHSRVALQEHLRDAGSAAEVGVDLKEPAVGIQQTLGRSREKVLDALICAITVLEPRPEVRVPRRRPTILAGAILLSSLQRNPRGLGEFGRPSQRDFIGRKQGEQMRDVAHSGPFSS